MQEDSTGRSDIMPAMGYGRRAGAWIRNMASNPVPDATVNPLFPAIVERHYTTGVGYKLEGAGEINASLTFALKATANTPQGVVISHRQLNGQLMYSHPF